MAEWAEKTGHSWTGRVTEIASLATPKRLLVTHLNPLIPTDQDAVKAETDETPDEESVKNAVGAEALEAAGDFSPQCDLIQQRSGVPVRMATDRLVVDF